jgi:hypothetical protein
MMNLMVDRSTELKTIVRQKAHPEYCFKIQRFDPQSFMELRLFEVCGSSHS